MSEFGGLYLLWKHQNDPDHTKSVRIFRVLKLDTTWKKQKLPADEGTSKQYTTSQIWNHNY